MGITKLTKKLGLLIASLLIFGAVSCRDVAVPADKGQTRVLTDDLGKKVELPADVTRAVSLAPNLTEIVFTVGGGEKLVGVTTYCNYPNEAEKIEKVGDTLKPNIENIVALKPQVVFVSTASQLQAFADTLEKQNIKVFVTNPNTLEGVYSGIRKIGQVLGEEDEANKTVENLKGRVEKVARATKGVREVKTFVQIDKSLYTIGKESFLTDLVEKGGGRSVTADVETAYPKISKERARALDPEVIILSDSADNDEPNEVFANSIAVKKSRVYKINADILSRPGPRVVEALEQIARSLHPERFQ